MELDMLTLPLKNWLKLIRWDWLANVGDMDRIVRILRSKLRVFVSHGLGNVPWFTFEKRRRRRGRARVKVWQERTACAGIVWCRGTDERSTTQTVTASRTAARQPQLAITAQRVRPASTVIQHTARHIHGDPIKNGDVLYLTITSANHNRVL